MKARYLMAGLAALALGSCSYSYDLRAVVINGHLAFVVDPASSHKPDCIYSIDVTVEDGPPAQPAKGDDRADVARGVYWSKTFDVRSCENRFPVRYAAPLKGPPFIHDGHEMSSVEAKPLRLGVVYSVHTASSGGGYGKGWFRINPDRMVENFSYLTRPDRGEGADRRRG